MMVKVIFVKQNVVGLNWGALENCLFIALTVHLIINLVSDFS